MKTSITPNAIAALSDLRAARDDDATACESAETTGPTERADDARRRARAIDERER